MIGIGVGIGFNEIPKKIYFIDNFNRPDNASIGGTWSVSGGTWGVSNGKAVNTSTGGNDEYCMAPTLAVSDFTLYCDVQRFDGYAGVVFRVVDEQNHYYAFIDGSNALTLARKIGGAFTSLGVKNGFGTTGTNYKFRIDCDGPDVSLYVDNVLQFNISESNVLTAAKGTGMWKYQPYGTNKWDNFVLEEVG